MPEMLPRITVVTPSYNQAQFLEQTILSVIGQEYPNLEYILMDGGSNDGSVEIIKKYEEHFAYWQSEKDKGQSSAIMGGFNRATGDILCWLNSDDLFMPGALLKIGRIFQKMDLKQPAIVFGNCLHFYEESAKARGSDVKTGFETTDLELHDYMIQPSSFWTKATMDVVGPITEGLHFAMDWEWFVRAKRANVKFFPIPDYLSLYRIHAAHKSGSGSTKRRDEVVKLYSQFKGEKMGKAYAKLDKFSSDRKFIHKVVYASNHFQIPVVNRLVHLLFFNGISFEEYKQLAPR